MNWKLLKVFGIILGILSIAIAVLVFTETIGYYEVHSSSGDIYASIQNAAAQTADNIMYLGETIQMGLAGLLLVQGLAMFLGALCIQPKKMAAKAAPAPVVVPVAPEESAPVLPVAPVAPQPAPVPVAPVAPQPAPAPVAPQPTTWNCPSCNHTNEASFRFCQSCGTPKP